MERVWRIPGKDAGLLNKFWDSIQRHVATGFPFDSRTVTKESTTFRDLNLAFCDLMTTVSDTLKTSEAVAVFGKATEYLDRSLYAEVVNWTTVTANMTVLLRILRRALGIVDDGVSKSLVKNFVSAQQEIHYLSPARLEATLFLCSLFEPTLESGYKGVELELRPWILSLPELLWRMRSSSSVDISRVVAETLYTAARFVFREGSQTAEFAAALEKSLIPLFVVNVPNKGDILGPFVLLPEQVQRTLVELVFQNGIPSERLCKAVAACCGIPTVSVPVVDFAVDLFESVKESDRAGTGLFFNFVFSLLAGYSLAEVKDVEKLASGVSDPQLGLQAKAQLFERSGYRGTAGSNDVASRMSNMSLERYIARRLEMTAMIVNHLGRMTRSERSTLFLSWRDALSLWLSKPVPADSRTAILLALCAFNDPNDLADVVIVESVRLASYDRRKIGPREVSWLANCRNATLSWIAQFAFVGFVDYFVVERRLEETVDVLDFVADMIDGGHVPFKDIAQIDRVSRRLLDIGQRQTGAQSAENVYIVRTVERLSSLIEVTLRRA